jgi:hypothetical protein
MLQRLAGSRILGSTAGERVWRSAVGIIAIVKIRHILRIKPRFGEAISGHFGGSTQHPSYYGIQAKDLHLLTI